MLFIDSAPTPVFESAHARGAESDSLMQPEHTADSNEDHHIPRAGFFFALVRFGSLLLIGFGLLLLGIALIGFLAVLIRIGPTLVGSLQHLNQQMAGFILLISLMYVLIFPFIGLIGAVMAGIGFALGHVKIPAGGTPTPGLL